MSKLLLLLSFNLLSFNTIKETKVSYYAKEHHGKKTASGEKFNMYDYTAAHRTLAFNTKVKVTNMDNNKSIIVRINDRGPFIKSRDLDLSYNAFKSIANPKKGWIKVTYEIIN